MGIGMLLVLAYHYMLHYGVYHSPLIIRGDIGVDLFLIASGLGCFYSLSSKTIKDYFKARLKRIYPTFILLTILFIFLDGIILDSHLSVNQWLLKISGLSYFISGDLSTWYISAILVLYLFSPLLFAFVENLYLLYGLLFIVYLFPCVAALCDISYLNIFIFRMISFILGAVIAYNILRKKEINIVVLLVSLIIWGGVMACGYINIVDYPRNQIRYVFYPLIAFGLIYGIKYIKSDRILGFMGKYSLEIYLIHQLVFRYLSFIENKFYFVALTLIVTCSFAMLVKIIINKLYDWTASGKI